MWQYHNSFQAESRLSDQELLNFELRTSNLHAVRQHAAGVLFFDEGIDSCRREVCGNDLRANMFEFVC